METVSQLLQAATLKLQSVSDSARLDAELLLCAVLHCDRLLFYRSPESLLTSAQQLEFNALLTRRLTQEPIAHLIGKKAFWTLSLSVDESTLIPRPDTETLVQCVLDRALPRNARVLDLGTGTGAVALALATERPDWMIVAVDNSEAALMLAKKNCKATGVENVHLVLSHWFDAVPAGKWDAIVSNPPYLASDDEHLCRGELQFEPISALVSEQQGYADLYHIIQQAASFLVESGWVFLEHGYTQAEQVRAYFMRCGYRHVASHRDLGGHERVTIGQWFGVGGCHAG